MADNWVAIQALVGRSLLMKVPGQTEPARYAHDRAMRVVRCVERIAPQATERIERLDLTKVAALYAGVAQNLAGPGRGPDDEAYDGATELAGDQMKELLGAEEIELVGRILREQRKRDTKMPEGRVLADALALEEFGLIGLWNQSRQFHASGKTLEQLVKLWKAQHDYNYWESRLRDGFHYEVARRAAKERLSQMNGIYERLQREHLGDDIGGSVMGSF